MVQNFLSGNSTSEIQEMLKTALGDSVFVGEHGLLIGFFNSNLTRLS